MRITKIYGAPGTGKTTDMMRRLEQELRAGTKLGRIAFVTHTVSARDEARKRAREVLPHSADTDFKFFRTIHGICYGQVSLSPPNVMQADDYIRFGEAVGIPFSTDFSEELDEDGLPIGWLHSVGNEILAIRQLAAARMLNPFSYDIMHEWPPNIEPSTMRYVLSEYVNWMRREGKFDFVDMLQMYMEGDCQPLDIDVLFIDEAQDLSKLQWAVVRKFMTNCARVYIAGDDDQSIYGFIGADPMGFYEYKADEVVILDHTYRLRQNIWSLAQKIILSVSERQDKKVSVRGPGGEIDFFSADSSMIDIKDDIDTMIIARHHSQLKNIARDLEARGTPFTHRGRTIAASRRARALHAYFVAEAGSTIGVRDAAALLRLANLKEEGNRMAQQAREYPHETVDRPSLEKMGIKFGPGWVERFSKSRYDTFQNELIRTILNERGPDALITRPKIDLTTYHASKGREARHVILFTNCFHAAWESANRNPDDERRLAYVGVSRAMERLTIVMPTSSLFMKPLVYI